MSNDKSVHEKVEEYLTKRQADKEFQDIGHRAGGTAKEMKAYSMIRSGDLLNIEENENVAANLVKKDKVYPKLNIEAEKEKGVAPSAAFMKMKLRELVQVNPPRYALARKIYVEYIEKMIAATADAKTLEEFTAGFNKLKNSTAEWFSRTIIGDTAYDYYQAQIDNRAREKAAAEKFKGEALNRYYDSTDLTPEKQLAWKAYQERSNDVDAIERELRDRRTERNQAIADAFPEHADTYNHSDEYNAFSYLGDIIGKGFYKYYVDIGGFRYGLHAEALKYDAITEEKAKIEIEALKNGIGAEIQSNRDELHAIDTISSIEEEKKVLGFYGSAWSRKFYFSDFPKRDKKYLTYNDIYEIRNTHPTLFNLYADTYKKLIREAIAKRLAEKEKRYKAALLENAPKDDDWSFAEPEKKGETTKSTVKSHNKLEFIKRIGGLSTEDITTSKIAEHYLTEVLGFKAVTFGLTVTDKIASAHIRHFIGAMADLGEILNMDIKSLNELHKYNKKNGGLQFSIGAFISRFPAFYRDDEVLINLTKSNGDGALAHEYAHYLDNALAYINNPDYRITKNSAGMYGSLSKIKRNYYAAGGYENVCTIKNEEVCDRMVRIMNFIYYGNATGKENGTKEVKKMITVVPEEKQKKWNIAFVLSQPNIDAAIKAVQTRYTDYTRWEQITAKKLNVYSLIIRHFGYKEYEISFLSKFSNYYNTSSVKGDYWSRDWELFARANEVYIYDKLQKAGRYNNYLVSFWEGDGLYPFGEEREGLFVLFDELYAAIKQEYKIPDFKPWTDKRTDDYIILDTKENDETEKDAVVVPVNDEEKRAAALKKIQHFNTLLMLIADTEAKMQRGGKVRKYADGGSVSDDAKEYALYIKGYNDEKIKINVFSAKMPEKESGYRSSKLVVINPKENSSGFSHYPEFIDVGFPIWQIYFENSFFTDSKNNVANEKNKAEKAKYIEHSLQPSGRSDWFTVNKKMKHGGAVHHSGEKPKLDNELRLQKMLIERKVNTARINIETPGFVETYTTWETPIFMATKKVGNGLLAIFYGEDGIGRNKDESKPYYVIKQHLDNADTESLKQRIVNYHYNDYFDLYEEIMPDEPKEVWFSSIYEAKQYAQELLHTANLTV